ncbi:membrane-associated guanylate kinase, WW and PDZ domain-containing protein 3 isoform X4 [Drosophila mauritiana]|uniref:Membrane-associated guanylate kinase, WW and PDZ domain-containing protein 3 isoform X4 n=1 Tax=Drosophila mauritiana TaxID=7226 RepID=A0A6P8K636_DROMA|nr:membrane-associated guanylate kinase, WW and PDZ domain-containing protein 3 isoform X4 [Drosophila mauritiana]
MRLGGSGIPYDGDPLTMSAAGNDYAELCDLGPSRWSARPYGYNATAAAAASFGLGPSMGGTQSSSSVPTGGSAGLSGHHLRSSGAPGPSSFEAEDIGMAFGMISPPPGSGPYVGSSAAAGGSRVGNSTSSLRGAGGRSGLYYSPPGTSYTIVERPHSPHYYFNSAGVPTKGGSLPGRGSAYLSSSPASHMAAGTAGTLPTSTAASGRSMGQHASSNGNKKRPISPEQVLRMFGATQSSSVPTSSYHYSNGGTRDRDRTGRGGPASSPPSTTHQIYRDRERERDRSVPNIHELTTRTVSMSRDQQIDHGFGICVKGGKDSGLGVYISRIEENSVAERAGLRPGDTILEVNGTPFTSINHEEALKRCVQILKSSRQISMTVRAPPTLNSTAPLHGFGPPSRDPMYASMAPPLHPQNQAAAAAAAAAASGAGLPFRQTCSWMDRHGRPASPPMEYGGRRSERRDRIRRVELLIEPGQSLGLMIRGGVEYGLGIFVTGVDKDSVADRSGLMIGDEILEVNGQSFLDVTHDEAVGQLKYHKRMSLVIRDVGKVPHSCTSIEMEPWDAYSPTGTRARRKGQIATMVEEKARSLLPRHHFASLSYYIAEYSAKAMTIDAFVAVLLEMLDTYEKHTLVTEIRELVFPEDRTRYDELVYRRERDPYSVDRHRRKGDPARDLPVTADDLEIIAATGRSPSSDSGLGMTVTDIHKRPALQLPHRPMSAGPILHRSQPASHYQTGSNQSSSSLSPPQQQQQQQHYQPHHASLRHLGGIGGNVGSGRHHHHPLGPSQLKFRQTKDNQQQEYGCDEHRTRRGSETLLPEYEPDAEQSMQRLSAEQNGGSTTEQTHEHNPNVVPDHRGNLHITVKKTKPILGIAIEGGANTKHPLPRIINIHENGAAFEAGGLEVGQLILEVDGTKVEGLHHQEVARLIAECFANREKAEITFLVVEAKKSNLEPKPTALIFLEA